MNEDCAVLAELGRALSWESWYVDDRFSSEALTEMVEELLDPE